MCCEQFKNYVYFKNSDILCVKSINTPDAWIPYRKNGILDFTKELNEQMGKKKKHG